MGAVMEAGEMMPMMIDIAPVSPNLEAHSHHFLLRIEMERVLAPGGLIAVVKIRPALVVVQAAEIPAMIVATFFAVALVLTVLLLAVAVFIAVAVSSVAPPSVVVFAPIQGHGHGKGGISEPKPFDRGGHRKVAAHARKGDPGDCCDRRFAQVDAGKRVSEQGHRPSLSRLDVGNEEAPIILRKRGFFASGLPCQEKLYAHGDRHCEQNGPDDFRAMLENEARADIAADDRAGRHRGAVCPGRVAA